MISERPVYDDVKAEYDVLFDKLTAAEQANDAKAAADVVGEWDVVRRRLSTWSSLTGLKFSQDTRNPDYKAEREYADELSPKIMDLDVAMMKRLLATELRGELSETYGDHAFRLWTSEITTFEPQIQDDLAAENKLSAAYTELKASAEIPFDGETYNLSGLYKYFDVADRDTRHSAQIARWDWVQEHGEELDRIYDEMVKLRHEMATKMGYEDFVDLGYRRMSRIDYNRADVDVFRKEVREHVVPLVAELYEKQRERLGLEELMFWDTGVYDQSGNPVPDGGVEELTEKARTMFDRMHPELSEFFGMMADRELLDLDTRAGKAGGGFCTWFADYGVPYIFANFNGTKHDAEVFTHEAGHAFQCYKSAEKMPSDYVWPTLESCEIHSMSLEFLTWPHMELFFNDDAERFRTIHLSESLSFIPYGTAVDHFQHLVYENPDATPEERHAMWQQMEEMYLPWRNWGDIEYGAKGGQWQIQGHIYGSPFYYIDYVLAMTCALQFWERMHQDYDRALDDYIQLCERGGEAAFQALAKSAGLTSPFEAGCLSGVVDRARAALNL